MKKYSVRPEISKTERDKLKEYSDLLAHLLYHRGIKTSSEAKSFLNPDYDELHDPFLLKDMEKAVNRIADAINNNERVTIYSDYDADGIPGAVILSDFFKKVGFKNFDVYIPHRNKEGFGLNIEAVKKISESGTNLLVTIDCGIADIKEADYLLELGVDLIITDHHEVVGRVPKAYAIINPKQKDCQYPEKMLCGSAVVFKLVQAFILKKEHNIHKGWEKWLLDMVGIATLSDMVPLIGENRIFARYGLLVLRKTPRMGILKLLKHSQTKQQTITEDDVGFTISPRINAASRMGEPKSAFLMLSTDSEVEAGSLVEHLNEINDVRKGKVASMVKEIKKSLKTSEPEFIIARGNPSWSPSLLGLAANSIMEEYNKPVFLWGRGEGSEIKGSCRSQSVSVIDLMEESPEGLFRAFGGHKQAGGFVLDVDKVALLENELNGVCGLLLDKKREDIYLIDKKMDMADINDNLFNELNKLAPFGVGNHKPLFVFENVAPKEIKNFGKNKNHLELSFKDSKNRVLKAISFFKNTNHWNLEFSNDRPITLIAHIEKSYFFKPELRLRVVDIIPSLKPHQ